MINWIKEVYGSLIDLVGFIVGHTSDHGADIAIRALPILSPLPNAIGMYYVSMHTLGFTHWQALAMALSMELGLFGLSEVALMMFDGLHTNERLYRWPFAISVLVAVGIMILIIIMVWSLETAHPILAVLPLFSAAGAMALALRRWHARNVANGIPQPKRQRIEKPVARIETQQPASSIEVSTIAMQAYHMQQNGMTVAQIADALQKSPRSISNYLRDAKAALPTIAPVHTNGFHKAEAA